LKRHFVGDPNSKTIAEMKDRIEHKLVALLPADGYMVFMAWINRFPQDVIDPRRFVADIDHGAVADGLGLKFWAYKRAVDAIIKTGLASRVRIRSRGRVVRIAFDKLKEMGEENAVG
jgi:hypothetical protein